MHDHAIDFQLVPPGTHRRNAFKWAKRTLENHFICNMQLSKKRRRAHE
jgi:hypothetical protein